MKLVFIALGRGAAFQIADIATFVGDDQGALELARLRGIDAEIGGELHRAAHALGHIDKSTVGKHRRVQGGEEIVRHRHHCAQILLHQVGMVADRFGDRAEDHPRLVKLVLEGGGDRNAVEHRVHRHAGQRHLLVQRNAQLLVGLQQLGIDFIQRLFQRRVLGRGIIIGGLIVDLGIMHPRPIRLLHGQPALERAQPPFQHPFRLALLGRNKVHRVFRQPPGRHVHLDIGDEAVFVLLADFGDLLFGFNGDRHYAARSFKEGARMRSRNFSSDPVDAWTSSMAELQPKLTRRAQEARSPCTPMAVKT